MANNFFYSFRARLLMLVIVALIPILAMMLFKTYGEYQHSIGVADEKAMAIAELVKNNHTKAIQDTKKFLKILSKLPELKQVNVNYCNKLFSQLLKEHPNYSNIALISPNGDVVASGLPIDKKVNISGYDCFQKTLHNKKFAVGSYRIGRISKKTVFPTTFPVMNEGQVKAVILVGMDLKWISNIVKSAKLPPGSILNIFDENGFLLARYPDDSNVGKTFSNMVVLDAINKGLQQGTTRGKGTIDGIDKLFAYLPLTGSPKGNIYISVGIPTKLAMANVRETLFFNLAEIGIMILLFGLLIWTGSEIFILKYIRKLVEATNRIAEGNMTSRTGLSYKGELGNLARAFDQAVDSIQAERQKLFTLIDQSPGFAFLLSRDHSIRFFNKSFRELFGEPLGRPCFELIMGSKEPCPHCPSQAVFISQTPYDWETTLPNGQTFNLFERLLTDINGSPMVFKTGIDITGKKQAEIELARLDRLNLVGQMAAGIAHEVRNPMTTVRGLLQILMQKIDCAKFLDHFNIMIQELDRANSIISEYLDIAKTKGSVLQEHNLNQLLQEIEPLINSSVIEKGMNMQLELNDVPKLLLNKKEINQLILNLVNNGLEAMEPGGMITIKTFTRGDKVILAVQDQGSGIPQSVLDKLGTPFITTKDQGTGLGLAVSYSIAARHNALIEVDSCSNSTTFRVSFSYIDPASQPACFK